MKSFCAVSGVVSVALASEATAAALSPQAPAQSASAPTLVRIDGKLKTPTGAARTGTVAMVASLYADKQNLTPLWVEPQLVTLDEAGRYTVFVGTAQIDGVSKEFYGVAKELFGDLYRMREFVRRDDLAEALNREVDHAFGRRNGLLRRPSGVTRHCK